MFSTACSRYSFNPVNLDSATSITPGPSSPLISKTEYVAYANKQVDFMLVLDDSNSMLPELKKLAAKLAGFVQLLDAADIDWQMCLTTTRGPIYGQAKSWSLYTPAGASNTILKKGTSNLHNIFTQTINDLPIGGTFSGDERGTKATVDSLNNATACYRPGAAISVILISDEDVRSVGGDPSKVKAADAEGAYQPLEDSDRPSFVVEKMNAYFGSKLRFTFNSIIVKPGDRSCEILQDKDTSPSHPGFLYQELSRMTAGGVGSICDSDYSDNLNTFKDRIVNSLSISELDCVPDKRSLKVKINGQEFKDFEIDGRQIKYKNPLIEGTKIETEYKCLPQ